MEEKYTCMRFYVSGKVQGVWYRASTKTQAEQLGLTGWARNLPDGRVEVVACGLATKVTTLQSWLKKGPELAKVTEVTQEELEWRECQDFKVL